MPRFLTGDELGSIKCLRYTANKSSDIPLTAEILHRQSEDGANAIQTLAATSIPGASLVATGYGNGQAAIYSLSFDDEIQELHRWTETRFKPGHRYLGMSVSDSGVYSCTSNGALRHTMPGKGEKSEAPEPSLASLPSRLKDWRMSLDHKAFAYGGEEVDLSIWDTEIAFQKKGGPVESEKEETRKRKRESLFPGETWRAKNVPNDFLGLRQPIRISTLTFIESLAKRHHVVTGTELGDIRRYDTRAGRRPVSDWKGVNKMSGIKVVEKGHNDHELFVGDNVSNLLSMDLRTGGVLYAYKGISGAVNSIASAPGVLLSASLDRYARIHSTFSPPEQSGQRIDVKGAVLEKVFMKSTPTVVVWDQNSDYLHQKTVKSQDENAREDDEDEVWDQLENIGDNEGGIEKGEGRKQKKTKPA